MSRAAWLSSLGVITHGMKILTLLLLMSAVVAAADSKDWERIATISSYDDVNHIHIKNLLLSHGIEFFIVKKITDSVLVPPAQAEQASKLLRTDAQKSGYAVWFGNDLIEAALGGLVVSNASVSSTLGKQEFSSVTALGRFLRSKDILNRTNMYPYIASMWVHERQYLVTTNTTAAGYDIDMVLKKSLEEHAGGCGMGYQVYDGGNRVCCCRSATWERTP